MLGYLMAIFPSVFVIYYIWTGPRSWYLIKIILTLFCILIAIVGCGYAREGNEANKKEGR